MVVIVYCLFRDRKTCSEHNFYFIVMIATHYSYVVCKKTNCSDSKVHFYFKHALKCVLYVMSLTFTLRRYLLVPRHVKIGNS